MSWIRLDDQIFHHPKAEAAGPYAMYIFVACIGHCKRYRTGGFIADGALSTLVVGGTRIRQHCRILEKCKLLDPVKGGYRVRNYAAADLERGGVYRLRRP